MTNLELTLVGGVIGSVLTLFSNFLVGIWNKRKEGQFTALMLALILEDYAEKCIGPYYELTSYDNAPRNFPSPSGNIPKLPEYPDKFNWRTIGIDLTEQVLRFRVRVGSDSGNLNLLHDIGSVEDVWASASELSLGLGNEALRIARALRRTFGLSPMKWPKDSNLEEFFTDKLNDINIKRIEDGRKQLAEFDRFQKLKPASEAPPA